MPRRLAVASVTEMNILFIHNNFPAQFGNLARELARPARLSGRGCRRRDSAGAAQCRPAQISHAAFRCLANSSFRPSFRHRMPPRHPGALCSQRSARVRLRARSDRGPLRMGRNTAFAGALSTSAHRHLLRILLSSGRTRRPFRPGRAATRRRRTGDASLQERQHASVARRRGYRPFADPLAKADLSARISGQDPCRA